MSIHRADCRNLLNLAGTEQARLIDVAWSGGVEESYPVEIAVEAYDRKGLLRDVTAVVSNEAVNIVAIESQHRRTLPTSSTIRITVEVRDIRAAQPHTRPARAAPERVRLPAARLADVDPPLWTETMSSAAGRSSSGACALMTNSERHPATAASLLPVVLRRQAEA